MTWPTRARQQRCVCVWCVCVGCVVCVCGWEGGGGRRVVGGRGRGGRGGCGRCSRGGCGLCGGCGPPSNSRLCMATGTSRLSMNCERHRPRQLLLHTTDMQQQPAQQTSTTIQMYCRWGNSVVKDHEHLHLRHDRDDDEQKKNCNCGDSTVLCSLNHRHMSLHTTGV